MNIIYGITGLLIGSLILFLILYPKIKNRIIIDKETEVKNQQIQLDNLELTKTKDFLLDKIDSLKESVATQEENVNTIYNKRTYYIKQIHKNINYKLFHVKQILIKKKGTNFINSNYLKISIS